MGSVLMKNAKRPYDKKSFYMCNFTIKWLLITAVLLLGLSSLQTNAQNITITNVQGSETSSPYIHSDYMDGWTYNELRWDGYVSFTAEGYTLPVEINVMGTSGTNCGRYITVEDDTTGMFMVDNLIPGTYVIQMTDNNGSTGTYEQGVTVGEGNCYENVFLSSRFENNYASVFITDNSGAEVYNFDSLVWHVYRDSTLVFEEGGYGEQLSFSNLEDLEYGLYNVEAQVFAHNCSWTTTFEADYVDLCAGFWADLMDISSAGLENNEGYVSVIVGGPVDNVNFWGVVHDAENYYENNQYIDNAWDSVTVSGLAEGDYMFEISYNNGNCNDTIYFTIERDCNFYVNVSRLSDSNDTLTLMPNVMYAQACTLNENRDTVMLKDAVYIWNDGYYGAYYEYQDLGEAYELFVDYNGCELTIEGSCDEDNMTPSCYSPMSEINVTNPSASNNNGAISNVGFATSDMFPYHVFVFNEDGDFIGSNYVVSETGLNYVFDGLASGTYRIYEYKEDVTGMCTSFSSVGLSVNCETMEVSVETITNDSTSNAVLVAEVMDLQEETQIYPDDDDYEWFINGNVYHGRIINASDFVEPGLLEYSYMLNVSHNGCVASTEGDYIVDINCTMSASVTGITPMNLAADSDYAYAIVSISVNNGTAPYMVNDNGSNDYGAWYETDSFEYYLYDDEMQEIPMTLYVIDAFGCTDTVEISGMLTCEMSASLTYNSSSDVVINITAEGDDYYPISIYCDYCSNSFVGSTTTSTFTIPENSLTADGRYELVAANGCVTEVWIDGSEICTMELANYTVSNPTSSEIGNGSITIDVVGGFAPYYGTYYKMIGEDNYFYYNYTTSSNPIVISNLSVGEYIIGVTDARGCMIVAPNDSTTITLESNCQITSYSDYENGNVTIRINHGTAPYTITLEDAGVTYTADSDTLTIENVTPGMHFYTIVDARGCSEFSTIEAIPADCENVPIYVTGNVVNTTSVTNPNGSISLTVTGGEAPYTYYWITGETTESISGLYPDEYWVYVNDNNGCYGAELFTVEYVPSENLFDELYIDVNYHIEVITVPTADGPVDAPFAVAHVQAFAGVPPYNYEWNVASTYSDQQALAIYENGAVCVNVTDAADNEVSGCIYIELPSIDQISNEIVEEVAGIVDTCINSSAIADAHVTNVELEEGTHIYHVTWTLIEKNGLVHELTVDYPVDSLATGIYAFNLYLRCNGQRVVSSFSTRLYLTGGTESVETFSVEKSSINAYPNPFNDMLNIEIDAAENDNITINVYNVSGQIIYTANTGVSDGVNNIEIATSNYGAGVYFINVVGNSINETIKVVK